MEKRLKDLWVKGFIHLMDNRRDKSQKEIAQELGYDPQSLTNVKRGRDEPGYNFMETFSGYFGLSMDRVARAGQMIENGEKPDFSGTGPSPIEEFALVPMTKAKPRAGTSSLEVDDTIERHYSFRHDFLTRKGSPDNMVMFRVGGDSMHPLISDEDVVLVDCSQTHPHDGRVYLVRMDDDILVKWVLRKPGKIILRSENDLWSDIEIDYRDESQSFEILGRVVWIGKEL